MLTGHANQKLPFSTWLKLLLMIAFCLLQPIRGNTQDSEGTETPTANVETYDEALLRAANFTGSLNSDWQPYSHVFSDGIEMVLMPVGCFQMGNDANAYNAGIAGGVPIAGRVCFNDILWIDRTEVTQADFERLGGVSGYDSAFSGENRPVEMIPWQAAREFCRSRRARLPTEAEWEYAARGVESWIFPWGNDFEEDRAIWNRRTSRGTADVGSLAAGASWVGALDMAGNVWEWTSTLYWDYPYPTDAEDFVINDGREMRTSSDARVIRGGSWDFTSSDSLHTAARSHGFSIINGFYNVGFRCVRRLRSTP